MKKKIKKFAEGGKPLNLSDESRGVLNLDLGARMSPADSDYWSKDPTSFKIIKAMRESDSPVFRGIGDIFYKKRAKFTPMKKGGKVTAKSKTKKVVKCTRGDGCAKRGKTKGRMV